MVQEILPEMTQLTTQTARRLKELIETKFDEFEDPDIISITAEQISLIINFKNELKEITTKDLLNMNNCKECHARIFITSGGCAECSESCPNFLRPLMYADNSLKQIKEIEGVEVKNANWTIKNK